MEFLLLWWDELDDLAAACRHLSRALLSEMTAFPPLPHWSSAIGEWLRLPA